MRDLRSEINLTESKLQLLYDLRAEKVKAALRAGMTAADMAQKYGVTKQRIWQILASK